MNRTTPNRQRLSHRLWGALRTQSICVAFGLWLALLLGFPGHAIAHKIGLSHGTYTVQKNNNKIQAKLSFALAELLSSWPQLDANKDKALSPAELQQGKTLLQQQLIDKLQLRLGDKPCQGKLSHSNIVKQEKKRDGVALHAQFSCTGTAQKLSVSFAFLPKLAHGHRHIVLLQHQDKKHHGVHYRSNPTFKADLAATASKGKAQSLFALFIMGIEHILIGFDHLLFLFALIILGGRLRELLWIITAFTIAHSITLGLATLKIWVLSPSIVEPVIALSVAYIGFENFFVKDIKHRWLLTFGFGLIHGFGFAGALGDIGIPSDNVVPSLLVFNLGVEAGQLLLLALFLPLIVFAHKRQAWFPKYGVPAFSTFVVLAGLTWFFTRVF